MGGDANMNIWSLVPPLAGMGFVTVPMPFCCLKPVVSIHWSLIINLLLCSYMLDLPVQEKEVFGRPFVKQFDLCYRSVVLSVCSSACDVRALWPNGWMDQDETWQAGRPRHWQHCVRWGPSSPSPKGPQFWPISVVAKWLVGLRCHLAWR